MSAELKEYVTLFMYICTMVLMKQNVSIKYVEHFQTNSQRMDKFNFGYSTNNIPIATER